MARTELPNGIILPAEYSDDWYDDMTSNLSKLDEVIGSDAEKLSAENVGAAALSNDYDDLDNKPALKPVATSGDYDDLDNKPALKPVATSGDYDDLDNKPDLNPYDQHLANTDIHVTAADKSKWNNGISQSYVLRYSSTAITDNSTIAYSTLDNTDNIKATDKIIDVDGKIFSIVSVDSDNSTVTVGSALIDLALDANVMHLSGNETAAGQKTFSGGIALNSWLNFTNSVVTKGTIPQSTVNPYRIYFGSGVNYGASLFNIDTSVSNTGVQSFIFRSAENVVSGDDARFVLIYDPNRTQPRYLSVKGGIEPNANNTYDCGSGTNIWKDLYCYHGYFRGQQQGDEFSSNARTNLTLLANRDTSGQSCCVVDTFRENTAQGTGGHIIGFGIKENSIRYEGCRFSWLWDNNLNGYSFSIRPTLQGANQAVEHCIGLSTDKWDKINGINPGALSMPDLSNGIDISGYITLNSDSSYIPLSDGYIYICCYSSSACGLWVRDSNNNGVSTRSIGSVPTYNNLVSICIPVVKNVSISIFTPGCENILTAKFYPCLGNV